MGFWIGFFVGMIVSPIILAIIAKPLGRWYLKKKAEGFMSDVMANTNAKVEAFTGENQNGTGFK